MSTTFRLAAFAWLLAVILALEACTPTASSPVEPMMPSAADGLLGTDRDATFDEWVRAIGDIEVISTAGMMRLGTTWTDELAVTRARFQSAKSVLDVYYALVSLNRSLHDAHSRLEIDPSNASGLAVPVFGPPMVLPFQVRAEYPAGPGAPAAYVVTAVAPSVAVPVGSTVLAVDGITVDDLERQGREWLAGNSPEALREDVATALNVRFADSQPAPAPGTPTHYRFADPNGQPFELDFTWQTAGNGISVNDPCLAGTGEDPSDDYLDRQPEFVGINYCVYATNQPSTKLVRFFSLLYEFSDFGGGDVPTALRQRLTFTSFQLTDAQLPFDHGRLDGIALGNLDLGQLVGHLSGQSAQRLLIDVRENGGGNFDPSFLTPFASGGFQQQTIEVEYLPGLQAMPELLDEAEAGPQASLAKGYLLAHPGAERSPRYPFICESAACGLDGVDVPLPANAQRFGGQVAILGGPGCVSSCDNFVSMMRDSGFATLVGQPTRGASSPVRVPVSFLMKDGATRFNLVLTVAENLRTNGELLDGAPPPPDVPLYPSAATRGRIFDAVLAKLGWN
jgi:hypothetical protein